MNKWILTSFYTIGTGYEKLVPKFKQSAVDAGIDEMIIDAVPNLKDWHLNTRRKALLILNHLDNLDNMYDAVVFVDIDAVFHGYPELFDTLNCDFAAHFRNWNHGRNELLSGTLYFEINSKTRELVSEWIKLNRKNANIWEQKNLQRALHRSPTVDFERLPIEYCTIFDDKNRSKIEPVIEHFQMSRKFRYEVSK